MESWRRYLYIERFIMIYYFTLTHEDNTKEQKQFINHSVDMVEFYRKFLFKRFPTSSILFTGCVL
ncbi:hypothetical protein CCP3SC1AL1_3440007 [Gammaproteobacteria bacterium]